MRVLFIILGCLFGAFESRGQGYVQFATRAGEQVNAPVSLPDGTRISAALGFSAQLFAGKPGAPISSFQPAFPMTSFHPNNPGYVVPKPVAIVGILPGETAAIVMRAFDGLTWEESVYRGESNAISVTLSTYDGLWPLLVGLEGFQVNLIPEPEMWTVALLGLGIAVFIQKCRHSS